MKCSYVLRSAKHVESVNDNQINFQQTMSNSSYHYFCWWRHWTHWGQVTHICVSNLNIVSDNGLSPGRCQAIIWPNTGILLFGPLWAKFIEIRIKIQHFSFMKMHLKCCLGNGVHGEIGHLQTHWSWCMDPVHVYRSCIWELKNVICNAATILSLPQSVKSFRVAID